MSQWENPPVEHAVNVARGSPHIEFLRLLAGFALVSLLVVALVWLAGRWLLLPLVSYERERALGDWLVPLLVDGDGPAAQRARLQDLGARLARHLEIDPRLPVTVHLSASAEVNAYATFGGHVILTRGLLDAMPSENALALVLGHELGHVQGRHALLAAGNGLMLGLLWSLVSGDLPGGTDAAVQLGHLSFSRDQERAADSAGLKALRAEYGHAGGAADAFRALARAHAGASRVPALLATHPGLDERITTMTAAAAEWDPARHPLRPKWW